MIHSTDYSYWLITTLTLHVDWSGMVYSSDSRAGSWDLSNRAAWLPTTDAWEFPLVIHGELNQTIPLTTPSSSYLKRQYLKPQIKQAHLSIKPPPHPSNMFGINKLPLFPTPTSPFEGFTEGFRSQLAVCKKYINSKLILTATKRWRNNQNQIEKRKIYFQ